MKKTTKRKRGSWLVPTSSKQFPSPSEKLPLQIHLLHLPLQIHPLQPPLQIRSIWGGLRGGCEVRGGLGG